MGRFNRTLQLAVQKLLYMLLLTPLNLNSSGIAQRAFAGAGEALAVP